MGAGHEVLLLDESIQNLGVLVQRHGVHILSGQESVEQLDVENMFLPTEKLELLHTFLETLLSTQGVS